MPSLSTGGLAEALAAGWRELRGWERWDGAQRSSEDDLQVVAGALG